MLVTEFLKDFKINSKDRKIVEKVYKKIEKTKEQWLEELNTKVVLNQIEKKEEPKKVQEKEEEVVTNKKEKNAKSN